MTKADAKREGEEAPAEEAAEAASEEATPVEEQAPAEEVAEAPAEEVPTLSVVADTTQYDSFAEPEEAPPVVYPEGETSEMPGPPEPADPASEEVQQPGEGESLVVYRGDADSIEAAGYRFRPDQPVIVPSDVVEELLTIPFEPFEEVKE